MDEKVWHNAMVIYANWTHLLQPSRAFTYTQVQSRFLVWCESGKGTLVINNKPIKMTPGMVVFTPWNHSISWITDAQETFIVGAIHIIPNMPEENPPNYNPFHSSSLESEEFLNRKDEKIEGFEDIVCFNLSLNHPMLELGRYVISRFSAECPEFMLRTFPRLLLYELYTLNAGITQVFPNTMQRMLDVIEHYLEDNINMKMLIRVSMHSQATIYRMFEKFFGKTPREYILQRRLERAAQLLHSTGLQIQQIARRLQFDNQFYFSKCFKEHFNLSPRQYRNSLVDIPAMRPYRESSAHNDVPGRKHWFYVPDSDEE